MNQKPKQSEELPGDGANNWSAKCARLGGSDPVLRGCEPPNAFRRQGRYRPSCRIELFAPSPAELWRNKPTAFGDGIKGDRNVALIPKVEPKQEKKVVSARLDEETHLTLQRYAEFLGDATHEYIIGESLKRLFRRDKEFRDWLEKHQANSSASSETNSPIKATTRSTSNAA